MGMTVRLILGKTWSPGTDKSAGMGDEQEARSGSSRLVVQRAEVSSRAAADGTFSSEGLLGYDDHLVHDRMIEI